MIEIIALLIMGLGIYDVIIICDKGGLIFNVLNWDFICFIGFKL